MDRRTVDAYEGDEAAERYLRERSAFDAHWAHEFASATTGWRADVGSGPGHYASILGQPLVSLDASHAMLRVLRREHSRAACVQADIAALPFRRGALGGAWASKSYQHLDHGDLPLALADAHRALALGARLEIVAFAGDGASRSDDSFPGRLFALWDPARLTEVVHGAGFGVDACDEGERNHLRVVATRGLMLPDLVRPGLRVLICGFNPSIYAAERGVAFARPGNRFWPAALEAGLVSRDRDPWHAVRHHGVGFTDLVKRATVAASELSRDELRAGFDRVARLCEWLRPEAVCLLGLTGWRALADRKAAVGWQEQTLGGRPVYVMPNPSGLNASTRHAGYVEHLTRVSGGA